MFKKIGIVLSLLIAAFFGYKKYQIIGTKKKNFFGRILASVTFRPVKRLKKVALRGALKEIMKFGSKFARA